MVHYTHAAKFRLYLDYFHGNEISSRARVSILSGVSKVMLGSKIEDRNTDIDFITHCVSKTVLHVII
jgi:hypothetical protein